MSAAGGLLRRSAWAALSGALALAAASLRFDAGRGEEPLGFGRLPSDEAIRPEGPGRRASGAKGRLAVRPGEELRYDVRWLGVTAGALDLRAEGYQTRGGSTCMVVEMTMHSTNPLLEAHFPVRERSRSWIDADGVFSRGYESRRSHSGGEVVEVQRFDYGRGKAVHTKEESGGASTREVDLPGPAQDVVSWHYYLRSRIASGEREIELVLAKRSAVPVVRLTVGAHEEIDLASASRVRAVRLDAGPELVAAISGSREAQKDGGSGMFWFDPASGILLRADVPASVGRMQLELAGTTGAPAIGVKPGATDGE